VLQLSWIKDTFTSAVLLLFVS